MEFPEPGNSAGEPPETFPVPPACPRATPARPAGRRGRGSRAPRRRRRPGGGGPRGERLQEREVAGAGVVNTGQDSVDHAPEVADHLAWARLLVAGVTPETNLYASRPTIVTWSGMSGATKTRNRSVCSAL